MKNNDFLISEEPGSDQHHQTIEHPPQLYLDAPPGMERRDGRAVWSWSGCNMTIGNLAMAVTA